ncbi:MAG: glycosyl transferase [Bacteroidetes bacterium GWF2_40_14]|nr:MAG: glycosyl transferase [Bacteroidetes bacterium GWF2_40_14]
MLQFLSKAEWILFIIMAIPVGYYLVFSFFSLWGGGKKYPVAKKKSRVVVLIPAYKEDRVIEGSVRSLMAQEYPENKMDIVVISDKMRDETNEMLSTLPVKLLAINPEISSKAVALNMAIESLRGEKYDLIVILDADNVVDPNFISEINDAFYFGLTAIQAHRTAKNLNNDMAILDAISEEINNSIFRKGHVNMGFSSALIGSGMAFDYKWFKHIVKQLSTSGEDKELEILLFKDRIFVDYLDNLMVYDEKIQGERGFYNQRRRWIAAQFGSLFSALKDLPGAIFSRNIDYVERIFVWMLPPKIIIMGIIALTSLVTLVLQWRLTIKWWALLVLMLISFAMAVPDFLITKRSLKAINRLPLIFIMMFINLFRTKGVNKKFIHTNKDF